MSEFISLELRDYLINRDIKPRDFPPDDMPSFPSILNSLGKYLEARCPKCGRITSIRVCYGCRKLMCEECLLEHQIICLHKEK